MVITEINSYTRVYFLYTVLLEYSLEIVLHKIGEQAKGGESVPCGLGFIDSFPAKVNEQSVTLYTLDKSPEGLAYILYNLNLSRNYGFP
jgi:hypothetical protein